MAYRRTYFDGPVTTPQIVESAVTEEKIADNAVTSAKIKDETITGADIGAGQVQTADIADGAVTQAKLGSDVSIVPLEDNAVTTPKIADNAVIAQKIANNAVVADKIAAGAVTSTKIADGSITGAKIAANAITKTKMADNSVGYAEIASQSLEPRSIKTLSGLPPTPGQMPVYDESQGNLWWFKWVTPGAAARPLTPPITTDEIGDGQVTPAKLSFTPAGLTPIATVNLLNESSADDIDQVINLDAYIPAGANFALLQLRTSAGQLMASPTVSAVIWDDYVTEPVFLANLNQGMIEGSVVTQSGPVRLYGPSAPARTIRVAHIKNGQIAITQVYLYGYA